MERNQSIDLIKVVAMYMVLMLHTGVCRSSYSFPYIPATFTIAGIAIPLFFMVSGYLLTSRQTDYGYSLKKIWGITKFSFCICLIFDSVKYLSTKTLDLSFPLCWVKLGTFSIFWYFGAMILIYLLLPYLQRISHSSWFEKILVFDLFLCLGLFFLNYYHSFEEVIPNTFRIINWITYFLLGAFVRNRIDFFSWVRWYFPFLGCLLFTISVFYGGQKSYELHFPSPICMFYAVTTFVCILRLNITYNVPLKIMSGLFLPIYAIHMTIIWRLLKLPVFNSIELLVTPSIGFTIDFIACALLSTAISFVLMKIPYVKGIFKI